MPPETQTETQEGGDATPATDAQTQTLPPEPAPAAPPTTVAFDMSTEEGRKSFTDMALELVQPHFDAMKEKADQRERSMKGQLGAAKAYQDLDEGGRQAVLDHSATKAHAIAGWVRDGVPKEALEKQHNLAAIDEAGQAILDTRKPAPKAGANDTVAGGDLRAAIQKEMNTRLGPKLEAFAEGSANVAPAAGSDTAIWAAYGRGERPWSDDVQKAGQNLGLL